MGGTGRAPFGGSRCEYGWVAGQNRTMTDATLETWWTGLTPEQRERATGIAARPAPRGMAIDDLATSMIQAGLPTSRMIWTGQPEHLVEMLDEVAEFVMRRSTGS